MIMFGEHVTITGHIHIAAIEGTRVSIGRDCLVSSDITFRTGDSHSILDANTGARVNPFKDITIGDHVWIEHTATILKGTSIGSHSIVATGAVVVGKRFPDNCIIGRVPAKIIKEGVDWYAERIKSNLYKAFDTTMLS